MVCDLGMLVVVAGTNVQSDDQLHAYIKDSLHTANALVGTCRIGSPTDPLAVVDPDLKVGDVVQVWVVVVEEEER